MFTATTNSLLWPLYLGKKYTNNLRVCALYALLYTYPSILIVAMVFFSEACYTSQKNIYLYCSKSPHFQTFIFRSVKPIRSENSTSLNTLTFFLKMISREGAKFWRESQNKMWIPNFCYIKQKIFYVHVTVHRNKFLFNKTNRRTNFPKFILSKILHILGSSSAHHQEFSTVHSALVYAMQVWWQLSRTFRMELVLFCCVRKNQFHPEHAWKLSSNLHDIYQCRMYSGKLLMMGRRTSRNM